MWHQAGLSLLNYQDDARSNKHMLMLYWEIITISSENRAQHTNTLSQQYTTILEV